MKELLDEFIDDEFRKKYKYMLSLTLGKIPSDEALISDEINAIICMNLSELLFFNYDINFTKYRLLLHIVLYNYIYVTIYGDEFLEKIGFIELVESTSPEQLLSVIDDFLYLRSVLFSNYITIITDQSIEDTIVDNFGVCKYIENFEEWNVSYSNEYKLVIVKLMDVLFELNNWCTFSETELTDDILVNFLLNDINFFDIIKEEFGNIDTYLYYKELLIQELYLSTYLYLAVEKKVRVLTESEEILLTFVELSINNTESDILPRSKDKIIQMVHCFFNYNFSKYAYLNEFPIEKEKVVKLSRKKVNSLVVFGLLD